MMMNISDVMSVVYTQSLQSNISHSLTFIVIFLSVVLLHDALVRSKQLNTSWWSTMLSHLLGDHTRAPPGPWWNLPLLGYLPWIGSKPYVTLWNLSGRYGSVYQIRFGGRKVVVLNGQETIRQAFVQQADRFAGRPDFPSFAVFCEGRSLAFSSMDPDWIIQRKVALRTLGLFTSRAKLPNQALIQHHAVTLAERLIQDSTPSDDTGARAVDPFSAIESAVVAILFEICFGTARDGDKELYSQTMQMLHEMRGVMPTVQSVDIMPWLASVVRGPLRQYTDSLERLHQLATNKIDALISVGVPDEPTCIVHALHHACLSEVVNGSQRARIMATVQDFIGAGSEVVVNFIHWAILYAAKHPGAVQERVRKEIRRTIGWTSAPVAADRARMPYTEACMWEIVRHACVAPMSIPHATVNDTVIAGCSIKAGTIVFANFYSTGWDPKIWNDEATFQPERFLTPDGSQVDRQVINQFMCFGAGRRRCPGAQFGTLEMFLFFVVLMQRCTFSASPGHELSTDGNFVLTNQAKRYHVLVQAAAHDDDDDAI